MMSQQVNLNEIYYFQIIICSEKQEEIYVCNDSDDDSYIHYQSKKKYMIYKKYQCKELSVWYNEISLNPDQNESSQGEEYKIKFLNKYKEHYLVDANKEINDFNTAEKDEYYVQNFITFISNKGEESQNIQFEDDQLFFCQKQNINELLDYIFKSYLRVTRLSNFYENDFQQLDDMKKFFNQGQFSYFVIEKIKYKKVEQMINGQVFQYDSSDMETKYIEIVASQDQEFQKHFHLLHKQHKFSAYSIQKTIEKRFDTIIYRSFKDIIRLCNYHKINEQTESYTSFTSILSYMREKDESFFKLNNKKISLDEIKSIVYKNTCIEGVYPFNIYLNTFKEPYFSNRIRRLTGNFLSDNPYKFTHHLCTQVGNLFYSYNDSGIFSVYIMQIKEKCVQKRNDFIKIRVLDFFPLDQQIDEISEYIYKRLDIFDEQLLYFFNPQQQLNNELDEIIQQINKEQYNLSDELNIDRQNKEYKEHIKTFMQHMSQLLKKLQLNGICNLTKSCYQLQLENLKIILRKIKRDPSIIRDISYEDAFYRSEWEVKLLYKSFLKLILTNKQVNKNVIQDQFYKTKKCNKFEQESLDEESKSIEIQGSRQHSSKQTEQGDGSAYKLLLRKLGYSFLSHYFSEFKYFHCWSNIISEIELNKYSYLNNNSQKAGILFSNQIKEFLKEYIEPLFISEQKDFFEYYHNWFEQKDQQKYPLKFKFQHILNTNQQTNQNQNNSTTQNSQNRKKEPIIKRQVKNSYPLSIHLKTVNNSVSKISSQSVSYIDLQKENFLIGLHQKHKEQRFQQLIDSFSEYSSSTNTILNKALFPLILEKPLPYHQFFGENMTHEFLNAIFKKDDLILQVYKIIVQNFPSTPKEIENIKNVTCDALGHDILQKNRLFQLITDEAYNYIYDKPQISNYALVDHNKNLPQDFLSTLFMIYDALYFMRNKTYYEKINDNSSNENEVEQFFERGYQTESNSKNSQKGQEQVIKIIDVDKEQYFSSYIRHMYKDYFKELGYYYFNSVRMKYATFTQREKLSYIGFLLIRDPKTRYTIN